MTPLLDSLTAEQRAAVETSHPNVYVQAAAGSGKTTVLAARVRCLIDTGVDPGQIRCFTFTRSAAEEMRRRIDNPHVDVTTFHSWAARHVVPEGHRVATEIEESMLFASLYEGGARLPRRDLPGEESLAREILQREAHGGVSGAAIRLLIHRARELKLVPKWNLLPAAIAKFCARDFTDAVEHVLLDEAQDCTPAESILAKELGENFFAVGDPRQAIMGFRGANFEVPRGAKVFPLSQSFRFGANIADIANEIAKDCPPITPADVPSLIDWTTLADALARGGETVVLARTHYECELIASFDHRVVHVRHDPLDVFSERDIWRDQIERGRVPCGTIHSAKGREFKNVILAAFLDERRDDEETRVIYVGVTRAKRALLFVPPPEPSDA